MVEKHFEIITEFNIYVFLIPLLPLLASFITLTFGRRYFRAKAHLLPILALFFSFLLSIKVLVDVINGKIFSFDIYSWMFVYDLKVGLGFLVDPLSAAMMTMVTCVSFLIHIYSVGYMNGDPGYYRFFAYISLFVFFMLMLVLCNNLALLYLGWEGVGLCSYLLIGFWYPKKSASDAGKKAFIVCRFGDFGFALGIFLAFYFLGTVYYHEMFQKLPEISNKYIEVLGYPIHVPFLISFLLFCGAIGKSAQFPLHVWLPDAMEGPTPVSALIHAATMVTAGVFMVCRLHPLFELSDAMLFIVAIIGAFTCFMSATIAPTQFDIKRVIAYSTLSQLGYMFMACGVGAYIAGMFHLLTHAYFKALLFLGAGSIIHLLHHAPDPNDLRIMGGLKKYMPITFWTLLIASLSISGIPGFAGFFSKDEILAQAFFSKYPWGKFIWFVGWIVASMTAFYTFRVIFRAFYGEFKGWEYVHGKPHESPRVMTIPLIFLAIGSIFAGWIGIPEVLGGKNHIEKFLEPVLGPPRTIHHIPHSTEYLLMLLSIAAGLFGIFLAWLVYIKKPSLETFFSKNFRPIYTFLFRKWYFDELYLYTIVRPTLWFSRKIICGISDNTIIEGIVNGSARLVNITGTGLRILHTGIINHYSTFILIGVLVYLLVYLYLK